MQRPESRGFTLIEVVVALAIVAIGMLAVFKTIGDTVNNVDELRDRSFAEWIADNRITEMRISGEMPSVEETAGEVEFAGRQWHWVTKVSQTQVQGLRRIDVSVRRDDDPENSSHRHALPVSWARRPRPRRRQASTGTRRSKARAAATARTRTRTRTADDGGDEDEEGVE